MYQVIQNDNILPVDIDGTLIKYLTKEEYDCGTLNGFFTDFTLLYGEKLVYLRPMEMNIALVKHHKKVRNYYIRIHSANGKEWAEQVINKLGLDSYVDSIETKANKFVDDKPVSDWMPTRIFLDE